MLFIAYLGISYIYPVNLHDRTVTIIIEPGDSFQSVGDELLAGGVVSSKTMLFLPARWRNIDKKLVPGRYDFTGKNSCRSVLDRLERGDFLKIRLTIYEGSPIWKVASLLRERLDLDSADLIKLNTDSAFLAELNLPRLEGYLYPETYFIPWGTGVREVVREMTTMYHAQTDSIWPATIYNNARRREGYRGLGLS